MHSKNFYDHKITSLTPRPLFVGDVKKESKVLCCNISGNGREVDSVLGHDLKSEVSRHLWSETSSPSKRKDCKKNNIAFWQNFFSYKYTRLTYGILYREIQEENEEGKRNQHDSKNGQDGKHQSLIRTSPCVINVLTNTQGKWYNSIPLVYAIKCILNKK